MFFGAGMVAMVREDTSQFQSQRPGRTLRNLLRNGVEDGGREMGRTAIAGKKVRGEEESLMLAIKPHVPGSMSRKMDGTQTMPDINPVAVVEPAVRHEWLKTQKRPAKTFQAPRDPRPAGIAGTTRVVVGIKTRRGYPGSVFPGDGGHIKDMIEMSVRDSDPANGLTFPPAAAKRPPQEEPPADKSAVEQIEPRRVAQHVKIQRGSADLEKIGLRNQCASAL